MTRPRRLERGEVESWLATHAAWTLRDGSLHREFVFDDFVGAFGFMAKVAVLAERLGHHPDWSNGYARVVIDLTTHDVGGLTALDLALAEAIDAC
ncbi:MAG: 4a-hydroxytetrahydrobiopterin dehydratase [Planctomycetes bacterium]|nr:4a-hydroxytetrahydrobiopterin dehydratase [Planctomycetota bacterium]